MDELKNTFDRLRLPARCATPGSISVSVDSYGDPATKMVSAPLKVTGCCALPYAPAYKVTAAERGAADHLSLAGRPCPRQGDAEA